MKRTKKILVGNWKMNPQTLEEAKEIVGNVRRAAKNLKRTEIVLCPPFVFLVSSLSNKSKGVSVGAQDTFYESAGPFTGEVSAVQLSAIGCDYVIVGHSERRARGDDDAVVNKKVKAVVGSNIAAILCVGESVRDEHGDYLQMIKEQITRALKDISKKSLEQIIIAYEPVWAVGKNVSIRPRELHEMTIYIRKVLHDIYGIAADSVKVLYGGDATLSDCGDLIRDGGVSGLLVGRESLRAKNFTEMAKIIDSI